MDALIKLGRLDECETLARALHQCALQGNKKSLKKVLEKGIPVDYPNDEGQSALFCACLIGHDNVAVFLLSAGANPNDNRGLTPAHAACYSGNIKCLVHLLQRGGDLRLHDFEGRTVKDWAILNPYPQKRMKFLNFLDQAKMVAMSSSSQNLISGNTSTTSLKRSQGWTRSITDAIRSWMGRPKVSDSVQEIGSSHLSLGYGQVYSDKTDTTGFVSAITLVCETSLRYDKEHTAYNNGAFAVMESMLWDYTQVTAKRLHYDLDSYYGGVIDLLINEVEHIGKLRHPNILTLMGVCQTSNLDSLILLYEPIAEGSLYNFLHEKMERPDARMIQDISMQICHAIIFIHLRGHIHCSLSSHAISVVNRRTFKLGNFEYMIEEAKSLNGKRNAVTTNTLENAVYNWMAPEVMYNQASLCSDMFSYCAVLWEIFQGVVPWNQQPVELIKAHYEEGKGLTVSNGNLDDYYKVILEYGLQIEPGNRQLNFLHVRDLLKASPKDVQGYIDSHYKNIVKPVIRCTSGHEKVPIKRIVRTSAPQSASSFPSVHTVQDQRYTKVNQNELNYLKPSHTKINTTASSFAESSSPDTTYSKPGQTEATYTSKYVDHILKDRRRKIEQELLSQHKGDNDYQQGTAASLDSRVSHRLQQTIEDKIKNGVEKKTEDTKKDVVHRERSEGNKKKVSSKKSIEAGDNICHDSVPLKPARRLHYCENGLSWSGFPNKEGDEYLYTVQVKRETSPTKPAHNLPENQKVCTGEETDDGIELGSLSHSNVNLTDSADTSMTSQYSNGSRRDSSRKTSAMGNYSFIGLDKQEGRRSAGAKPACHVMSEPVNEEYSTAGKLSTAGSLYALYNDHSPGLPHGQREGGDLKCNCSTLPRNNKAKPSVTVKPETSWFGDQDSVRDLAKVFQEQIVEHDCYQAVMDGTMNKIRSEELVKDMDGNNVHQIAFAVEENEGEDTSSSSFTGDYNTRTRVDNTEDVTLDSGTESDIVTKWVDHELRKIKRDLTREIRSKCSPGSISPELFDTPIEYKEVSQQRTSDGYEQRSSNGYEQRTSDGYEQRSGDVYEICGPEISPSVSETSVRSEQLEIACHNANPACDFYFDDEMYQVESKLMRTDDMLHRDKKSSSLPMETVMKKTALTNEENPADVMQVNTNANRRSNSRQPASKTCTPKAQGEAPVSDDGDKPAYANIVTVRSSLEELGFHNVIHEMKNLTTGGSVMLSNDTLSASKVITKFKSTL